MGNANLFEGLQWATLVLQCADRAAAERMAAATDGAAAIAVDDPCRVHLTLYSEESPNLAAMGALGRLAAAGALEMIAGLEGMAGDLAAKPKSA